MIKKLVYIITVFAILTVASALFSLHTADTSGPGDPPPDNPPTIDEAPIPEGTPETGQIFAHLEYRHDVRAIDRYFLEIQDHPGEGIDEIVGGFVATNFHAYVRLRDVSVPTSCDTTEAHNRPHIEIDRERERWNEGMDFVQSLLMLNQSLRLSNITVEGEVLVCDVQFYLGGAWHDLKTTLLRDGFAKPVIEGYAWNWGAEQLEATEQ